MVCKQALYTIVTVMIISDKNKSCIKTKTYGEKKWVEIVAHV